MIFANFRSLACVLGSALFVLPACKTTRELHGQTRDDSDPTNVVTETEQAPAAVPGATAGRLDDVQRELTVTQGELENVRVLSQREKEALNARITGLEAENAVLKADLEKLKNPAQSVEPAPEVHKKTAATLWESARRGLKEGKVQDSLAPLLDLAKRFPKDARAPVALVLAGMAHYRLGEPKDAAVVFNQAIDKFPKRKETGLAWFGQAASLGKMGNDEDARLFFEEVLKRYPKSTEAREARRLLGKKKAKMPADLFAVFSPWVSATLK